MRFGKGIVVVCIFLLLPLLSYSGQGKVYGTVKNEDGKPVEFCVIEAVNSYRSTYSDKQGHFVLEYDTDSSHSLILFCLGYETKVAGIDADTLHIVLKHKVNKLNNVVVSASHKKGKIKHGILGKKNLKPFGICTGHTGSEYAIFLQADSTRDGQLENIYFYITDDGIPGSRFRVHVYDIDTSYLPGTDLLDSIVILHANAGNEWVSVNVSSRHISVNRSLFISMEWISGYGNDLRLVTSKNYPAAGTFNSPVIAFTEGYYNQGSLYYIRDKATRLWHYQFVGGTFKKNTLNLMIYATYTYHKK